MRLLGLFALGGGLLLIGSCATTRQAGQSATSEATYTVEKIVSYPFDVTWSAALDIINDRMWRAENINEPNGLISIAAFGIEGGQETCNCTGGGNYDDYKARLDIKIAHVTASGTKISFATLIDAHDGSGRYSKRVACTSTGKLEQDFIAAIDSVVTARQTP